MSKLPLIDSHEAWNEFNESLPGILDELLNSEPINLDGRPKHPGRGIYLFSAGAEHLYVGRTGITARSRKAGKKPSTSFSARWGQHTNLGSPPQSAPFAMKMARGRAELLDIPQPKDLKQMGVIEKTEDWWDLRSQQDPPAFYLLFQEAKRFIREELDFKVVELIDDVRGVRSHVAEVYIDVVLQTAYGDFSPS